MTFQEAKERFLELAAGRYCAIAYEEVLNWQNDTQVNCRLYVDGHEYTETKTTWEGALEEMRNQINPQPIPSDQQPGEPAETGGAA